MKARDKASKDFWEKSWEESPLGGYHGIEKYQKDLSALLAPLTIYMYRNYWQLLKTQDFYVDHRNRYQSIYLYNELNPKSA